MTRSTNHWMRDFVRSRGTYWGIAVMSFCEALFLPVPLEAVLIPYMIANRDKVWRIALAVTVACLLGGLVGYAIGYHGFQVIGRPLVESLEFTGALESFQSTFARHGFWAILSVAVSPVPFQVAMLGAGIARYSLWKFLLATAIARALRYFGLAWLVCRWGRQAADSWERHKIVVTVAALLIVAGCWAIATFALGGKP